MNNDRFARYGAATGVLAVILLLAGFAIATPDVPDVDAAPDEWATYFTDHQGAIHFGTTITGIGLFFYIWFLGSLRSALAAAEPGNGRLSSVAYGGGLIGAAFFVVALTAVQAAAFHPDGVDPAITRAIADLSNVSGAPAAAGFMALFAATAIVGYRYKAIPAPVAGLSALAAVTQPLAYGTGITDSGAFSGSGVLGLVVPVATFAIGIVALSIALYRNPVPRSG